MKLIHLSVRDFLGCAGVELAFSRPVVLILGSNGSGKSSLASAVSLAIRGEIPAMEGIQLPLATAMRHGKPSAVTARLELDHDHTMQIARHLGPKGIRTTITPMPALPWGAEAITLACHARAFLDLRPAEQKALFLGLVSQEVDGDLLAGLPLHRLTTIPATMGELAVSYAEAYEARRAVKIRLSALGDQARAKPASADLAAAKETLVALRARKEHLLAKHGEALGLRRTMEQSRDALVTQQRALSARGEAGGDLAALQASLDEARQTQAKAQEALAGLHAQPQAQQLDEEIMRLKEWSRRLSGLGAMCVIAEAIPCPLDGRARRDILNWWVAEIKVKEMGLREATRERERHARLRAMETKAAHAVRQMTQAYEAAGLVRLELEKVASELASIEQRLAALPVSEATETELAELTTQMATADQAYAAALLEEGRLEAERKIVQQRVALAAELADWETLCAALGPKGLQEQLLIERMAALVASVNRTLTRFGLVIAAPEPWGLIVNGVPAALLATSERYRVGVAIQMAVAQQTGLRWLVLDGADVLDRRQRTTLFSLLAEAVRADLLDQALVLATCTEEPEAHLIAGRMPAEVETWWLDRQGDGTVLARRLAPVEEAG